MILPADQVLAPSLHHVAEPGWWQWRAGITIVLALLGLAYTTGWVRLSRRHPRLARRRRLLLYLLGLLSLASALMSGLDTYADRYFWVHMVQHEALIYISPPLLLLGRPLAFFLWGLPRPWRHTIALLFTPTGPLRLLLRAATTPLVALAASTLLLWLWHAPAAYNPTLQDELVHDLEHLSLFLSFLLYWWALLGSPPVRPVLATDGGRVVYLVAGATQAAFLGAFITLSDGVLYTAYLGTGGTALSTLVDQRIGGAIMWFAGPLVYGLATWASVGRK